MKVVQINSYGGSEQLKMEDIPRPVIKPDQLLVRIRDAGVNPIDWKIREGMRRQMRPEKFPMVMGQDFAGEVVEAGKDVANFHAGDRVFGFANGSYAEFAAVVPRKIARIPDGMDFVTAASLPTAGLTAYQMITRAIRPARGARILIHGAAGGVGSIAVQTAKQFGANVIANASAVDEPYLLSIGADEVIDRKSRRFEDAVANVDAVMDLVGGDVTERSYAVVKEGGVLVSTVGSGNAETGKQRGVRVVNFVMEPDGADLAALARLVESGVVKPRLAEVMPFTDAKLAQDLNQSGHSHGKLVLEILGGRAA